MTWASPRTPTALSASISSTLNSALTNNPGDVQNFFEGTALNGFANSMTNALTTYTEPANGAFSVDLTGISSSNARSHFANQQF